MFLYCIKSESIFTKDWIMNQTENKGVLVYWSKKKLTKLGTGERVNIPKLGEMLEDKFMSKALKDNILGSKRFFFMKTMIY